jgi:hypothetical protein
MITSLIIFTAFIIFALLLFNAIAIYRVWLQVDNLEWAKVKDALREEERTCWLDRGDRDE